MDDKISKKASSYVINIVQKINSQATKLTTWDQAWDIISEWASLEGELISNNNSRSADTTFELSKDNKILKVFTWPTAEVFDAGDWDWTRIFKEVIEYIFKEKIIKIPRKKRSDIGEVRKQPVQRTKTSQISSSKHEVKKDVPKELEALKKRKMNLYHKIYNLQLKHKDAKEYIIQYNNITEQIKKLK